VAVATTAPEVRFHESNQSQESSFLFLIPVNNINKRSRHYEGSRALSRPSETGLAPESRVPELQADTAKGPSTCSSPRQSATTPLQQVSRFARRGHAEVPVYQSCPGVAGLHPCPAGSGSVPAPQPPGCRYYSHRKARSEGPGWPVSIQLR
jgi:hypothetical protein